MLHILERHAPEVLERATAAASARSVQLVPMSEARLPDFDHDEPLVVIVGGGDRRPDEYVSIDLRWSADRKKRLLANVGARLELRPIGNPRRPRTEVVLKAHYSPNEGAHGPEAAMFGRRVVHSALERFHREIVRQLEDYEETMFDLAGGAALQAS